MRAGTLDRRITLMKPTSTQDAYGAMVDSFASEGTVWANVKQLDAGEASRDDQHTAKKTVLFTIRYRASVAPTWKVVFDGETYDLTDVAEVGRREGLALTGYAREVKSGA